MVMTILSIISVLVIIGVLAKVIYSISKSGVKNTFKKNLILIIVACTAFIMLTGYVMIGSNYIEKKTWNYLETKGYSTHEIQSVEVTHSYLNAILSYDEWQIKVVYTDEPTSVYNYSIIDGVIVEGGVSGTTDKEDLKH